MTMHGLPPLTSEEFASLVDLAATTPSLKMSALHLTRLMVLGYVTMGSDGPAVTGEGFMHISENR